MKRKLSDLSKKELIVTLDALYTAASSARGRQAVKLFLRDLLTPSERVMLGRRIIIARMLLADKSYGEIGSGLRVSRTTIRRVHRWLQDQFPGYEKVIKEMEKEFSRRALRRQAATDPFSFAALKRKYPLHFLLFPTPKIKHNYATYPKR